MNNAQLKLVPTDPSFAELFHEWRQEEEMKKYNPLAESSIEVLRTRLENASSDLSDYEKAESYFWFIEQNSEKVGHISLQNLNKMMMTVEIGYGISSSSRSSGAATTAVSLLIDAVFEKTPLRKIIAYVHEENTPSIRVLQKVGFKQEGRLREHYLVNGSPATELIFGLLRQDRVR